MAVTHAAQPISTPQRAVTRRLAIAVGALFVAGVIAAISTLLGIAKSLDAKDLEQNQFYSVRAVENRVTTSKNYITSYAYWTRAYEALSGPIDVNWAYTEQNMG